MGIKMNTISNIGFLARYREESIAFHYNKKVVKAYMKYTRKVPKSKYDIIRISECNQYEYGVLEDMTIIPIDDYLLTLRDVRIIEDDWIHFTPELQNAGSVLIRLTTMMKNNEKYADDIVTLLDTVKIITRFRNNQTDELHDIFIDNHEICNGLNMNDYRELIHEYLEIKHLDALYRDRIQFDESELPF